MAGNTGLIKAGRAKRDEFYTRYADIEKELRHYKAHFRGKTVLCNSDDPYESNFFRYFVRNFNALGLKKLVATCYDDSPTAYSQLSVFEAECKHIHNSLRRAYKIEITEVDDGRDDPADVRSLLENENNAFSALEGNGDFRSEECIELLDQADIVVTNPPFSLFREFVAQLYEHGKKFVIIGNKNSITYKEVFTLIKSNRLWTGYRNINSDMWFEVPGAYDYEKVVDGVKVKHTMGCWFTNLETDKRRELLPLTKHYTASEYPKYDNYDAINVDKVADIPCDYYGVMGVPVTFLDKYNPEQFEILGLASSAGYSRDVVGIDFIGDKDARPLIGGRNTYARIFVKLIKN